MQMGLISVSSLESVYTPPRYYTGIKLHNTLLSERGTYMCAQFAHIYFNHSQKLTSIMTA